MPAGHYMANGDINPSRFVMGDTSADKKVIQATANAKILGVCQEGARQAPLNDLVTTNLAAKAGDSIKVYGDSDESVLLVAGGAITAFDSLRSDATGRGVTATSGQNVGAVAQEGAAAAGELIKVQITIVRNAV